MTLKDMIKFVVCAIAMVMATLPRVASAQPNTLRAFVEETVVSDRYVFPPGRFPSITWSNGARVESEVGAFPLKVTYYNSAFHRVTSAETPGRYGALVEGVTPSGFAVKRYVTLFCSPVEFDDYSGNVPIQMTHLQGYGIADKNWEAYEKNIERFSFGSMKMFPQHDPDAAIFLAGLRELPEPGAIFDTPRMRDRQWWVTLKLTLDGTADAVTLLAKPAPAAKDLSRGLNERVGSAAGYDKQKIENVRAVCRTWTEQGGVPNVTLVVHKGNIIFHEAFGAADDGTPIEADAKMWMASITKLVTGVLMMQFVDQGVVELDAPVNRYLPELNGTGNDRLTIRHLFTHTTGLSFAGEWASDWNPALENEIAQLLPSTEVGGAFSYNRVGYALAGKIIEKLTGRAVPYLFHDYVFTPLGMTTAYSDNTYGGLYCSVADLARFGRMLLHKGTSNGIRLFSEKTFDQMLPRALPVGDKKWGIGISPYEGHGLSDAAFGHGAASGTVFRIDPKNDLIIISARNAPGKRHGEFENKLIESCTALVKDH